jgi:predicted DNA-binding antitoxin AbrB/MazE fold protein
MFQNVDAIYDHGVFRLSEPLALPNGARVRLSVEEENAANGAEAPASQPSTAEAPTLLDRLKNVVGSINDLPEDSSTNLDHYLYGRPKQ